MKISFFGSSLLSAYWNGAATYYRGILHALQARGHEITFYEPDAFERQTHRDLEPPSWIKSVVYENSLAAVSRCLEQAQSSDLIIKASGVGVFDEWLEEAVPQAKTAHNLVIFWDVDAPATLERIEANPLDAFRPCLPKYDAIFTYGGGDPVSRHYYKLGAKMCEPIYNALDPSTHFPVEPEERFRADLSFLGNRLPDREARVQSFFFKPTQLLPDKKFVLGGSGWDDYPLASNTRYVGHVYTADHNAFNCSATFVLNVSRASMVSYGFSPATRVFEVAGAAGCLITDNWEGIETFFVPGKEILVADGPEDVARFLHETAATTARELGQAAYKKALVAHTYSQRARQVDEILERLKK